MSANTQAPPQNTSIVPCRKNKSSCWRAGSSLRSLPWGSSHSRCGVLSSGSGGSPKSYSTSAEPWTGGGTVSTTSGVKVSHGFTLECDASGRNLEVNWGTSDKFKLTVLTSVTCYDDPSITPQQPAAGFDSMAGQGIGTYNGQAATIEFRFTDAGEPGTNDTMTLTIRKVSTVVLTATGKISGGNHQAHKN